MAKLNYQQLNSLKRAKRLKFEAKAKSLAKQRCKKRGVAYKVS